TPRVVMRSGRQPVMSWPSKRSRPAVGASTPVTRLNSVVLPAPLGPITAWMAPGSTTRSTSATAVNPSNDFVSLSTCSTRGPPSGAGRPGNQAGARAADQPPRAPDHHGDQQRAEERHAPLLDRAQDLR